MGFCAARLSLALALAPAAALALIGGGAAAECRPDQLELRSAAGQVQRFAVELADDPDERAQGLMFREHMAMSAGMLFVFPEPKQATFWMKNTPLSLDMIFADAAGVVTHVHERAEPESPALIDGGPGVAFVLEINGGLAGPMGIAPGAVMRHPAIGAGAAWSCDAP